MMVFKALSFVAWATRSEAEIEVGWLSEELLKLHA